MVLGQILKVGTVIFRHRKAIYAVLTAQDRYISKSFRYGGYGKATSYGVRSGALIGGVAGAFINNAEDSPGNGIQTQKPKYTTSPPNKTRNRPTIRNYSRYNKYSKSRNYCRRPSTRFR